MTWFGKSDRDERTGKFASAGILKKVPSGKKVTAETGLSRNANRVFHTIRMGDGTVITVMRKDAFKRAVDSMKKR